MTVQELLTKWGFQVDDKPLHRLEERIEQIKGRLEFLSAAEVLRGLHELTERFSHFAEGLGTAATSAGLTVEELQRLQFAASQAGVGAEEVSGSMARMTRMLYEARNGSAQAKEAFAKAGITEAQIAGFRTGSDALAALADNMAGMTDPIAKQALAMQLLGRGSHNMVEFLSGGSEEMKKLGERAEKFGAVLSGKDVQSLREVEDSMSALGATFRTFAAHVAAEFAPVIKAVVHHFQEFYAANRGLLGVNIHAWSIRAAGALGFITGVVSELFTLIFGFANRHKELVEDIGNGIMAVIGINGLTALVGKLKPLLGPLKLIWEGFGVLGKGAGLFVEALKWLLLNAAVLAAETFPAISEMLLGLGAAMEANPIALTITAVAAAVGALVLALQAAYKILYEGGNFEDTWLGQLWHKTKGVGRWMAKMMGVQVVDPDDMTTGYKAGEFVGPESSMAGLEVTPTGARNRIDPKAREAAILEQYRRYQTGISTAAMAALTPPAAYVPGAGGAMDPSGRIGGPAVAPPPPVTITNNNSATFNVPPGTDERKIARMMPDAFETMSAAQNRKAIKALKQAEK